MKKWWPHTISCICNAVAATIVLVLFLYEIITGTGSFTFNDGLGVVVMLIAYSIYLLSDIWGLKIYIRYKNIDSVSFTDTGKIQVLLFFLAVVQIFAGYLSFYVIRRYVLYFSDTISQAGDFEAIIGNLLLLIFISAIIVFIGIILLLKAIKKKNAVIKKEIDIIGTSNQ